jgi:Rieske Fe-S protein
MWNSLSKELTSEESCNSSRRNFLKQTTALTLSASALAALVTACENTTLTSTGQQATLNIAQEVGLQSVGSVVSKTFGQNNGGRAVLIVRASATSFLAFSSVCTHEQCDVLPPASAGGNLSCPCHGAVFSANDGSVLAGPARSALQRFQTSFNASTNILTMTF